MTEKKEITQEILMADAMLRLTTLEKLLIDKGILTKQEIVDESESIAKHISKVILEKSNISKDLPEFIKNLEKKDK